MTGESAIDLGSVQAIDFHVHALRSDSVAENEASRAIREDQARRWKSELLNYTLDETANYYRERKMLAVVFPVDSERYMGDSRVPNLDIVAAAARHPDVVIPFASIDPMRGAEAIAEARDLLVNHGVRGFKFHAGVQGFAPDDPMAYSLYEVIAEHKAIALFHSGQTGIGRNSPGGGGVRLKYVNPMFIDDIAVDFPELSIVLAHPSFPWQQEALAIARHKMNVFIDLSGWSPKYFEDQLVQHANTLIANKVLFGSDFPVLTPDRWLADFAEREFRDSVRPLILRENAIRLLGLS